MRPRLAAVLLPLVLILALAPPPARAWGQLGHRLVAALAEDELSPAARAEVARLLADEAEPTLPGIAGWADDLREHDPDLGRRSAPWHYVNLGEQGCSYDVSRDCRNGRCVIEAIRAQTAILADRKQTLIARRQALKFVVHFIGDVHQPLHAGYARDKGGNTVQVQVNGRGSNLHSLWDSGMLRDSGRDETAWLQHLRSLPLVVPMSREVLPPDSARWARDSCEVVLRESFYPSTAKLPPAYAQQWLPLAAEQLRRAGTRLAAVLNAAL